MKNAENIEKLFKETFEHFESDVNANAWANVQSGMSASAGSASGTAAKFVVGKFVAGAAALAIITASVLYFSSGHGDKKTSGSSNIHHSQIQTNPKETKENNVQELQPSTSLSNSQPATQTASTFHSSNKSAEIDFSDNPKSAGASSANENFSENSNTENSTSSQPAHKYGNAPKGDGGMIRWNKNQNNSSNTNTSNNSDALEENISLPTVNIFVNSTSGEAPLTVEFINQGVASSLSWDFGDGSGSRDNAPVHTFEKAGNYIVILNAKNASGAASDKINIEVKPSSDIYDIPNIFTPNGDGENDLFFFKMKNIASVGVVIFSPKSGIVCEWNSLEGNWSGKLQNGDDAPDGIYFYTIQANGSDGISHSQKGTVTLKRH